MCDSEEEENIAKFQSYRKFKKLKLINKYRKIRMETEQVKRKPKRFWMRDHIANNKRYTLGHYYQLILPAKTRDREQFRKMMRMTPESFDDLSELLRPYIERSSLHRNPITVQERLAITIRYLATGMSQTDIALDFRIGQSTVPPLIFETCNAIWDVLKDKVLAPPDRNKFAETAKGFLEKWNFPNVIGAIDGKHVNIVAPPNSGSTYYNYKNYHSIVLLAVCDYRYRFTMIDVGAEGRRSDGGVFKASNMGKKFELNKFDLPSPVPIYETSEPIPFFLVGDAAFSLTTYLMKPYGGILYNDVTKTVFNYRLSRARRTIENSFGILCARWRIFRKPIEASLQTVNSIVKACVCLHNLVLISEEDLPVSKKKYCRPDFVDKEVNGEVVLGNWRKIVEGDGAGCLTDIGNLGSMNFGKPARELRDGVALTLVSGKGCVTFQWKAVKDKVFL